MSDSVAMRLAMMTPEERVSALDGMDIDALLHDWSFWGRPEQFAPDGNWLVWLILTGRGWGKPLANATLIPQPHGAYKRMGRLKVGDQVLDQAGQPCNVTGVYPQGMNVGLRITFEDSEHIIAGPDHEWLVTRDPDAQYDPYWWKTATLKLTTQLHRGDLIPSAVYGQSPHRILYVDNATANDDRECTQTCITVDSESHLFLATHSWVPTHNTRTGAEWVHQKALEKPGTRIGLLGRTAADARDVMVLGETGLLKMGVEGQTAPAFESSKRRVMWPNGSIATYYSAELPDSLRGPQFDYGWADELASYTQYVGVDGLTSWENLRIATRLGDQPRLLVTTTPKRVPVIRGLLDEGDLKGTVAVTRGKTSDNRGNLSEAYLDGIYGVYEGTHLAQQELEGLLMDDVEGALWLLKTINDSRIDGSNMPMPPLRIVGVDPSVAENPRDNCGIIVVGSTRERQLHKRTAWVLQDATVHGPPSEWAKVVVKMAKKWNAPIVAEINQGGDLVKNALQNLNTGARVYGVHSKVGKALRAEPIAMAYEQGRVHHVGYHADLESELTSWVPFETKKSPDRLDALVHALTALLIKPPIGVGSGPLRARSAGSHRIPNGRGMAIGRKITR